MSLRCTDCGKWLFSFSKNRCADCEDVIRRENERRAIERQNRQQSRLDRYVSQRVDIGHHCSPARKDTTASRVETDDGIVVQTFETASNYWAADTSSHTTHHSHTDHSCSSSYSDSSSYSCSDSSSSSCGCD